MHHFGHGMHVLDRRLRQDTMAEVENMAKAVPGSLYDVIHTVLDLGQWREQGHRIKIPLNADVIPEAAPGIIKGHAPIHADHVSTRLPHGLE
jgi:hypothetical protein